MPSRGRQQISNSTQQRLSRHQSPTHHIGLPAREDAKPSMLRLLTRPTVPLGCLRGCPLRRSRSSRSSSSRSRSSSSSSSAAAPKASDPLRILFCGSDAFSCESLRALHREHVRNRALVEALHVMVLPGRRTGRGLKRLREVPCKDLARELGLPVHQRETFTKWDLTPSTLELPRGINLVVVVSFGLFVPGRILRCAKYGGLNVHPSLLPDLRGPAPVHHAVLRGDTHLGVSLQTLDDAAFDHGTVLAQTPWPGIPIPPDASFEQVLRSAAARGADMLVEGLRDGVHVPPHRDAGWRAAQLAGKPLDHAPKVTKADGQVAWSSWAGDQFVRRVRVLGSVWTELVSDTGAARRVLFLDARAVEAGGATAGGARGKVVCEEAAAAAAEAGGRVERDVVVDGEGVLVNVDGAAAWVRVTRVKVEGKPERPAAMALKSFIRG
ncbi:hypothetical protein UVI_02049920 [Ustilaginoidea virens]|uniref:methionyl-tRNA formyltransferase n=1 Tax=Ustilaginoidea virens TaxID=1159556 RepID=A0A1B5V957_USTVR|nr:hypothetical protein UVI_02049920 [Ustilaginoidea virens]